MDSRLIHIHNKVILVCVFGLFLISSLCLWAQNASSTPSPEELISRIAEAEKKLVNMKIEGEASAEQRVLPTDSWKPIGVSVSSTAWFNGLPNSKARVDVHQETLQKKEGGFNQKSYSVSFDGQTGRIVKRLTGTPGAMSEVKRAERQTFGGSPWCDLSCQWETAIRLAISRGAITACSQMAANRSAYAS